MKASDCTDTNPLYLDETFDVQPQSRLAMLPNELLGLLTDNSLLTLRSAGRQVFADASLSLSRETRYALKNREDLGRDHLDRPGKLRAGFTAAELKELAGRPVREQAFIEGPGLALLIGQAYTNHWPSEWMAQGTRQLNFKAPDLLEIARLDDLERSFFEGPAPQLLGLLRGRMTVPELIEIAKRPIQERSFFEGPAQALFSVGFAKAELLLTQHRVFYTRAAEALVPIGFTKQQLINVANLPEDSRNFILDNAHLLHAAGLEPWSIIGTIEMPEAHLQFIFAHGPELKAAGFASLDIANLAHAGDGEQQTYALKHATALGLLECYGELMREVMRAPAAEQEVLFNNASALAHLGLDGSSGLLIARRPVQEQEFLLTHGAQLRALLGFDHSSMVELLRRPIVDANYILANADRLTTTHTQPHTILAEAERARR